MFKKIEDDTIIIGKKPIMNYVIACLTLFNSGKKQIRIKARGLAIDQAIKTVDLLRRGFIKDLITNNIFVGSEEFSKPGKFKKIIPVIDIVISKL